MRRFRPQMNTPASYLARDRAVAAVSKAKSAGVLPYLRGNIACVDCGEPAQVYDHRDYSKPLEVEPRLYVLQLQARTGSV